MLTGPQSMPVFGDNTMTPGGQAGRSSPSSRPPAAEPSPGGRPLGQDRAGVRGCDRLAGRHRRADRLRGLAGGEGPMSPRPRTTATALQTGSRGRNSEAAPRRRVRGRQAGRATAASWPPATTTPGCRRTSTGAPTSTPRPPHRREREVATFFGLSTLGTLLFIVAYFAIKPVGATGDEMLEQVGLSTKLLGLGLGSRCSASAPAPSTGPRP